LEAKSKRAEMAGFFSRRTRGRQTAENGGVGSLELTRLSAKFPANTEFTPNFAARSLAGGRRLRRKAFETAHKLALRGFGRTFREQGITGTHNREARGAIRGQRTDTQDQETSPFSQHSRP
jgi:hypothetical protein